MLPPGMELVAGSFLADAGLPEGKAGCPAKPDSKPTKFSTSSSQIGAIYFGITNLQVTKSKKPAPKAFGAGRAL